MVHYALWPHCLVALSMLRWCRMRRSETISSRNRTLANLLMRTSRVGSVPCSRFSIDTPCVILSVRLIVRSLWSPFKSRHSLDIHLSSHIHDLTTLIRDRALVLYFQPFTSVRFSKIASAFGLPESEVEQLVVGLIRSGDIKGRVDSQNKVNSLTSLDSSLRLIFWKILKARVTDVRAALFARAAQAGTRMSATNRKLLLRMRLCVPSVYIDLPILTSMECRQQADLVVKAPKSQLNASSGNSMIIDQLMDATWCVVLVCLFTPISTPLYTYCTNISLAIWSEYTLENQWMKLTTNADLSSTMLGLCIDSFLDMHGRSTESKVILARLMHAHIIMQK